MKISMLGVSRGGCYSPNHVDNDAAIFNKVCVELHGLGCDVLVSTEDAFVASCLSSGVVFGMPRSKEAISRFNILLFAGNYQRKRHAETEIIPHI